jgi:hypothetical protein
MIEVNYISERLSKSGALSFCKVWLQTHDKLPKVLVTDYPKKNCPSHRYYYIFVEPVSHKTVDLRNAHWKDEKDLKEINLESLK